MNVTTTAGSATPLNFVFVTIPLAVTGVVADDSTNPMGAITVTATDSGGNVADSVTSAPDGSYSLHLLPGDYTISTSSVTYFVSPTAQVTIAAGAAPATVNLTFAFIRVTDSGFLTDDAAPANPQAGVLVTATDSVSGIVADQSTSGPDGSFVLHLLPGTYTVITDFVSHHSTPPAQTVTVAAGTPVTGTNFVYLAVPVAVTGQLTDDAAPAAPVSGIVVTATDASGNVSDSAVSDASGAYSLQLAAGAFTIGTASLAGYLLPAVQSLTVIDGAAAQVVNFVFAQLNEVAGQLVDNAKPVASGLEGLLVTATDAGGNVADAQSSDATGAFLLHLAAGTYNLSFAPLDSYNTPSAQGVTVVAGVPPSGLSAVYAKWAHIRGQVLDGGGNPVAGLTVLGLQETHYDYPYYYCYYYGGVYCDGYWTIDINPAT